MIEYTLEFLASNGVEEVFVFCCAHAEQIVAYLESSAWSQTPGFVVHTIVSTNCISAGEAMRLIDHRHVIRADFVLVHGDVVANADLRRAIDAHKRRRAKDKLAMVTMCVKPLTQRLREERFGGQNLVFVTDPDTDRVLHYEEHAAPSPPAPGDERRASGRRLSRLPPSRSTPASSATTRACACDPTSRTATSTYAPPRCYSSSPITSTTNTCEGTF